MLLACSGEQASDEQGAGKCDRCSGASDCHVLCVCRGGSSEACQEQCSEAPGPEPAETWPQAWSDLEGQLLTLANEARAAGGCCDAGVCFESSAALESSESLGRAARLHARDMAERQYFAHDTPEGLTPFDRMRREGFEGCAMGENLAQGQTSAEEVVAGWLKSPDHCENLLDPGFGRVGLGYADSTGAFSPFWVQTLGD